MTDERFMDMISRRDALQRLGILAGGALSAPLVSGVLAGCRAVPPETPFTPQILEGDLYKLVSTLTELILPTTDTPGARDAGVPAFIDEMLATWFLEEDRTRFLTGLSKLDAEAQSRFGASFIQVGVNDQTALLERIARQTFPSDMREQDPEDEEPLPVELSALFRRLKELTVVGYYTSEVGATQELRMPPMGTYQSDIPYADIGRAWS